MKLKALTIMIMSLISLQIYAQEDFTYVTSSKDGIDYYYKMKSDDELGMSKELWIKNNEKTRRVKNKKGQYVSVGGGKTLTLMKINCYSKTYELKKTIKYNSKGDIISSKNWLGFPEDIVPNSIVEGIYDEVCD